VRTSEVFTGEREYRVKPASGGAAREDEVILVKRVNK